MLDKIARFYYKHIHYQTRAWHFWRWYSLRVFYTPLGDFGINDSSFAWFYFRNDFDMLHIQFLWFSYSWYWNTNKGAK